MGFQATFKALADPTRRKIIELLKPGRLTAGEIRAHFDTSGATISHHLMILKQANLVRDEKDGQFKYYELNLSVVEEVLNWLAEVIDEKEENV